MDYICGKHGKLKANIFKIYQDWGNPSCPECAKEEEQIRKRIQHEWAEKQTQVCRRAALESRLKRSCIPTRFQGKSFESYLPPTPNAVKILEKCKHYADRFPNFAVKGTNIILCGHAGTGKTHLACSIANYLIHTHEKHAVYVKVGESIRMVKETYAKDSKRTEQDAINWFKTPDLLILDEVGVQFGTDYERYILFEIINGRYEEMKPTILISNLAVDGLIEYLGERVIDRMKENGGMMMVFDWVSYRGSENLSSFTNI